MPKVFVWQSCGLHRPCTQTDVVLLTRQSACWRPAAPQLGMCWLNTVYAWAIWAAVGFFFFALHCFGLGNMGRGGVGWTLDFRLRRLVFGGFDRHVGILCCFLLAPGPTHCHGSCLNSEAPLSCSQECAAEKTREPSIKRAGCCESIGWNLHGLSHGFSVIFLHSEKTKWYVTVAEPNNG